MKKLLKVASILAVLVAMLVALTGCGGNKLTATLEENGEKITHEITFNKDNEAEKIKTTYTFKSDSDAKEAYEAFQKLYTGDGMKTKRSGKKIEVTMKFEDFAKTMGVKSSKLTKDDAKSMLEKSGYKVK